MTRIRVQVAAGRGEPRTVCAILAQASSLSKLKVKEAIQKGAVWLKRVGAGEQRLRRAQAVPRTGDQLSIYYDPDLPGRVPPVAECRHDAGRFSIWFKPAGLKTQGTRFGDHCSLLRQAELSMRPDRQAFPVHRLDREASGLARVAHDRGAAAALSRLSRSAGSSSVTASSSGGRSSRLRDGSSCRWTASPPSRTTCGGPTTRRPTSPWSTR